MPKDREFWVRRFWERWLFGLAFLPWYAAYDTWRGDHPEDLRDPRLIAFLVAFEVVVLWYARRRRVWWFPRRRS